MSEMTPDPVAAWNEKVKLFAGFLNALSIGLIGFAVLRPMTENNTLEGIVLSEAMPFWILVGLAIHSSALYVLEMLRKEAGK